MSKYKVTDHDIDRYFEDVNYTLWGGYYYIQRPDRLEAAKAWLKGVLREIEGA